MARRFIPRLALTALLVFAVSPFVRAEAGPAPGPVLTKDGAYVVDVRNRLAWPRCVEGMQWDGRSCTGEPRLMTYGEAAAWTAARARTDGVPWRLPRVTELRPWAGRGSKNANAAAEFFPRAPLDWYWTVTASIDAESINPYDYDNIRQGRTQGSRLGVQQGWVVNMATGQAEGGISRRSRLVVRLVADQ